MNDITVIDLDQPRTGYRSFISSWVHRGGGLNYVVDCGPASTIPHLEQGLRRLGVDRLDFIVLTHIHLDHGGGAGHLAALHPEARVVCWPKAAPHLVEPDRLWEGTRQVLGDVADLFGRPLPLDAGRLLPPAALEPHGFGWLHTPGHAPHHVSWLHDDVLFVGEAAGVSCPVPGGARTLRPATPPRFFSDVALASLDALLALDPVPSRIAYGHHGWSSAPATALADGRAQTLLWLDTLRSLARERDATDWSPAFQTAAVARLAALDPLFAPYHDLPDDLRTREDEYLRNTIEGMLGEFARLQA